MRNLKAYDKDCFEFHKDVIKSKRITTDDPTFKQRIEALGPNISKQFAIYDTHFSGNSLERVTSFGYSGSTRNDLLTLYSFKSKIIKRLRTAVTTTESNRLVNTCQNCTINEINSFDHFLPKQEFSEFIVNPKNLFPSCTMCNSYKNDSSNSTQREFLNLYLDSLPDKQYLFVSIVVVGKDVQTIFEVRNPNGIDHSLFSLIESHYKKLHLCERFAQNNNEVISSLKNQVESYKTRLPITAIKETVTESCKKNMLIFGYNYWKSILEMGLINCQTFIDMPT